MTPTTLITAETFAQKAGLTPPKSTIFQRIFKNEPHDLKNWNSNLSTLTELYNETSAVNHEANELNHQLQDYSCTVLATDFNFPDEILQFSKEADDLHSAIIKAREILNEAENTVLQCKENLAKVNNAAEEFVSWFEQLITKRPDDKSVLVLKLNGTNPTAKNQTAFTDALCTLTPETGLQSINTFMCFFYVPIWIAIHYETNVAKIKDYVIKNGFWVWATPNDHKINDGKVAVSWA